MNTSFPAIAKLPATSVSQPKISDSATVDAGLKGFKFFPRKSFSGPQNRVGGAVRGDCISDGERVQVLLPVENNVGLTLEAKPTLFVYIPQTAAKQAELTLLDGEKSVYKTTLSISQTPGVARFSIPANANASLKVGNNYQWEVSLICDSDDRAEDIRVAGGVQRVKAEPTFANQLRRVSLRQRPGFYAEKGLWIDTLKSLADLRQANPTDSKLAADWADLLKSQGLNEVAEKPLSPCCTSVQNSE